MTDLQPLRDQQILTYIEQIVSEYRHTQWVVQEFRDMSEFSSHPSAILSDGTFSVFVKLSQAENGWEQFSLELEGLHLLSEKAGILVPTPIANIPVKGGVIMILEGIQAVDRTPRDWQEIGRTLAKIHRIHGSQFGLDTHNYFGPLYQDNRPFEDWPTFYAERRLWPRLRGVINSGNMPTHDVRFVENLIRRLPTLCGPEVAPVLLHGDAQQNNFISTEHGAVVIDPAVYYGHPEMDLAYIDIFQPVPDNVLAGYQEEIPIESGFQERKDLWRIYGYLSMVEVSGSAYLPLLIQASKKYL